VPSDAGPAAANDNFRFTGLPPSVTLPTRWLSEGVHAEVVGAPALKLGPDAIIPAQQVVLTMGRQRVVIGTDGLGPFEIVDSEQAS
jgi:general secretion pathway protein H